MPVSAEVLKKLKRGRIFIETGCLHGEGIAAALAAGFEKIVSIEIDRVNVLYAQNRFQRKPVVIICGDTVEVLPGVLSGLTETATFWLDAHPPTSSPVIAELAAIAATDIKNHTILIDDRRLMQDPSLPGSFTTPLESEVRAALLQINPAYKISFADGYVPNDIIVAQAD